MAKDVVNVAAAVILDDRDRVLISKRSSKAHQGNKWEFPGGKIEAGETVEEALKRELLEEIGITAEVYSPLRNVEFNYSDKHVKLFFYIVSRFSGSPEGREGQLLQWIARSDLHNLEFPDANLPVIQYLQLPDIIQITGSFDTENDLMEKTERCLKSGIKLIQFRAHELSEHLYLNYAKNMLELCHAHQSKLVLNRNLSAFNKIEADGLHLNRYEMNQYQSRPVGSSCLFSVSCHNESELMQANKLNVDYCFLSPFRKAVSHDAGKPLREGEFSALTRLQQIPVYALGGVASSDIDTVLRLNGHGIAQVSAGWL